MLAALSLALTLGLAKEPAPSHSQHEEGSGHGEHEEVRRNVFGVRAAYSRHILRAGRDVDEGFEREADDMWGFMLSYEHVIIPEYLLFEIAKPFLWGHGRFDSPLDLLFRSLLRVGGHFEIFFGVGVTFNFRFFSGERKEHENTGNEFSVGPLLSAGFAIPIKDGWSIDAGCDYIYIPGSVIVTHEISPALGFTYAFR